MQDMTEYFGEPISIYTRAQAIEDGVLVDVSVTAREAGFKFPVAVTRTVWDGYVEPDSRARYHLTFHGLRHIHATLLLKAGVHPKVVSERLGHSKVGLTMDTYSHVLPDMQQAAVEALERELGAVLTV